MRRLVLFIDNFLAHIISAFLRLLPFRTHRVRCLLICGDETLLVMNRLSYSGQRWTLPGGGIKKNESIVEAAQREIAEELAITLPADTVQHMGTAEYIHGRIVERLEVVAATINSKDFTRQKLELLDAKWFPLVLLPEGRNSVVDEAIKILNSKT